MVPVLSLIQYIPDLVDLVDLVLDLGTPMLLLVSPYRVVIGSDVSGVSYRYYRGVPNYDPVQVGINMSIWYKLHCCS